MEERRLSILHHSDWHIKEPLLDLSGYDDGLWLDNRPPDVIVVTGDMVMGVGQYLPPTKETVQMQRDLWLNIVDQFNFRYPKVPIVAVPGNHDWCDYGVPGKVWSIDQGVKTFEVNGIVFTGLRATPRWKMTYNREMFPDEIFKMVKRLKKSADVLLTHYPMGMLQGLSEWVEEKFEGQAYLHGHEHQEGGTVREHVHKPEVLISNAATCETILEIVK